MKWKCVGRWGSAIAPWGSNNTIVCQKISFILGVWGPSPSSLQLPEFSLIRPHQTSKQLEPDQTFVMSIPGACTRQYQGLYQHPHFGCLPSLSLSTFIGEIKTYWVALFFNESSTHPFQVVHLDETRSLMLHKTTAMLLFVRGASILTSTHPWMARYNLTGIQNCYAFGLVAAASADQTEELKGEKVRGTRSWLVIGLVPAVLSLFSSYAEFKSLVLLTLLRKSCGSAHGTTPINKGFVSKIVFLSRDYLFS